MSSGAPDRSGSSTEPASALKDAMRVYPQGVTVVTTTASDGPKGITVSSFTSISLVPPLVMISLARGSALHDVFLRSEFFAVNFLADDQKTVSDRFAGRVPVQERFEGIKTSKGATGSPTIEGARAHIECRMWKVYDGGDHSILIGEVVAAKASTKKRPLVYYSQQYTTTEATEYPAPPSDILW